MKLISIYRWGVIQVKVDLLDTLPVISLGIRQTEQALFQEITAIRKQPNIAVDA